MKFIELLARDRTLSAISCRSKKHAFEIASEVAAPHLGCKPAEILDALFNREQIGSTAMGHGVAIPHGRLNCIESALGVLLVLNEPVDFDALDGEPVDIVFVLLVPEQECDQHLGTLAFIAKALNQTSLTQKLRQIDTNDGLYELIISA